MGVSLSVRTGTFISVSPIVKALALAGALSFLVQAASVKGTIDVGAMYSGVFDIVTIFTGFLATFYVFFVTKGNAFLESIKGTKSYDGLLRLTKTTIYWSVFVIILTYLLMVFKFQNFALWSLDHFVVFFWLANVSLIAINFGKCIGLFLKVAETDRKNG